MYHCRLNFYLAGCKCKEFDLIRDTPPPERFTYNFFEGLTTDIKADADVIFVNAQGMSVSELSKLLEEINPALTELILLAPKELVPSVEDKLQKISDIWTLPMSDTEFKFRFKKWQDRCKADKDFWQTSQYLEATINSVPNLIWYKDKEGIHEKVNDSFCRTVNKTKQQVEGRDHYYIWDVDPEEAGTDCMESDNEVMQSKKTCVSEETVQTGDGIKLMTTYKSPLYDFDGSVMGTVGVGIDVTQERAYEKEITQKNRALEAVFAAVDCGIICHSLDGKNIISINKTALKILGYDTKEELLEAGFDMIAPSVADEDKTALREAIKTLKEEGDSVSVEYSINHTDGEVLHVMGNVKLLKENGELFYQRFLLDCTEQKLQEEKNERYQNELVQALAIDYGLVTFYDLDAREGRILRIDESDSMFGISFTGEIPIEESMQHYINTFVYEEDRDAFKKAVSVDRLQCELSERKMLSVNYRANDNGEIKYYEMKVVRAGVWDENRGIVLGLRCVDEETREEMENKQLLEDALLQANRANKAKSVFLSNMSHDIRTPMNAVIGFTTMAISHIDEKERVLEYLKKIMTSGNHLLSLINDILDMSRIESGKVYLEETPCNIIDIAYDINNMIQSDAREKGLAFHTDVLVTNGEVYCDKLRLNQILLNVIGNAIKYTESGGSVSFKVSEKSGKSQGRANYEFVIKDTGMGMSEEFVAHIFEPFEREKNSTISGIQGTGLGMAITKNIVDMMNGSIKVKSEIGAGTEITIVLNLKLNSDAKNTVTEIKEFEDDEISVQELRSGHILLVEDNELNREIAQAILEDAGFTIESAENGKIAVDMIKASEPGYYSLVLMDVQMPVMNGYEASMAIRALENKELASIPIMAMTANAFDEDRREALKSGMNSHISKPIDVKKLFRELKILLAKSHIQK